MDDFLFHFARKKDEEIADFMRRWEMEITKAERTSGKLEERWKTHLFLGKLRVSHQMISQMLTIAQNKYEIAPLAEAAIRCFPNIRAHVKGGGFSRPHQSGKPRRSKRGEGGKKEGEGLCRQAQA